MNQIKAGQIAQIYVACVMADGVPRLNLSNDVVGQWALQLMKQHAFKKKWHFDGLKSEVGRWREIFAKAGMRFSQEELHQFLIEEIFPYIIGEGLSATGEIHFQYKGHKS